MPTKEKTALEKKYIEKEMFGWKQSVIASPVDPFVALTMTPRRPHIMFIYIFSNVYTHYQRRISRYIRHYRRTLCIVVGKIIFFFIRAHIRKKYYDIFICALQSTGTTGKLDNNDNSGGSDRFRGNR